MPQGINKNFDAADARLAQQKAEEIEQLKQQKKREREFKKKQKEQVQKQAFLAKFVAPLLLLISAALSYFIWMSR